jgi:hypothetical protein
LAFVESVAPLSNGCRGTERSFCSGVIVDNSFAPQISHAFRAISHAFRAISHTFRAS